MGGDNYIFTRETIQLAGRGETNLNEYQSTLRLISRQFLPQLSITRVVKSGLFNAKQMRQQVDKLQASYARFLERHEQIELLYEQAHKQVEQKKSERDHLLNALWQADSFPHG